MTEKNGKGKEEGEGATMGKKGKKGKKRSDKFLSSPLLSI